MEKYTGTLYFIQNKINNKYYIGQTTKKVKHRWKNHISELNRNVHHNKILQNSWNKYGTDNFIFYKIISITVNDINKLLICLNILEQKYINKYKSMYCDNGFNIRTGGLNKKLSPESKLKCSIGNKGKVRTDEMKQHMSKIKTGIKYSEDTKKKLSLMKKGEKHPMYNKAHCTETKKLIQEKLSGISYDIREKIINDLFIELKLI